MFLIHLTAVSPQTGDTGPVAINPNAIASIEPLHGDAAPGAVVRLVTIVVVPDGKVVSAAFQVREPLDEIVGMIGALRERIAERAHRPPGGKEHQEAR